MNEKSHSPIAILDGSDGKTLRQRLKGNQHIKAITGDWASAYAKVISEELPDVMRVADSSICIIIFLMPLRML